jgi:hypothetical protein
MSDNEAFTPIALALNAEIAEVTFFKVLTAYAGKIAAMKLVAAHVPGNDTAVEQAKSMGEWMLVEMAQATWGLTFHEAAAVVRRNLRMARAEMIKNITND